ncbi:MAG: DegT/DnrJ/EryC1/StrS family aminotransferase [Rhodoferax sp.]|nr:DegT/DnrJ/EryC1/StrS family aminotransferase [Rhodoferax sp.]
MTQAPPLFVTQPDLPPLAEFLPALEAIWQSRQLTNNGPFHQQLERDLCAFLDVPAISLFCNGTIALMAAVAALGLTGEVITTPYSFVATTHALRWSGLTPVFVDIEPGGFNLDPTLVEAAITPQTSAILPVHVYGYPCATDALARIADQHGLGLLYDAAHAFGVRMSDHNLLCAGELSVLSFHATKVFHTLEGGAVVCRDQATKRRLDQLKNFGCVNEVTVEGMGINGKMNELRAALGSLNLPRFGDNNERRAQLDAYYRRALAGVPGLVLPPATVAAVHNHGYFPVQITPAFGITRDALYQALRAAGVMVRRYFYPLISEFPMYAGLASAAASNLPVATRVAQQILCLPIYASLDPAECLRVAELVRRAAA